MTTTKRSKSEATRCAVCGHQVVAGETVFSISKGKLHGEGRVWGVTHLRCFVTAVDSPDAVLAELKRQVAVAAR